MKTRSPFIACFAALLALMAGESPAATQESSVPPEHVPRSAAKPSPPANRPVADKQQARNATNQAHRAVNPASSANATRLRSLLNARAVSNLVQPPRRGQAAEGSVGSAATARSQSPARSLSPAPSPLLVRSALPMQTWSPGLSAVKPGVTQHGVSPPMGKARVGALKSGGPVAVGGPNDAGAKRLGGPAVGRASRNVTLDGNQVHRKF